MPNRRAPRTLLWLLVPGSLHLAAGCGGDVADAGGACGNLLPGDLVITEFLANPAGADNEDSFEWIEIYNATDTELDLRGVLLSRTEQDTTNAKLHEVGRSWLLPPQSYGVTGALLDDALDVVPHIDYGYAADLGNMKNGDGRLVVSCGSEVIDEVVYQDEQVDGRSRGFSGAIAPDALVNDDLSQWCDARTPFDMSNIGTPGERNDVCQGGEGPVLCFDTSVGDYREAVAPTPGSLVITEIMSDPSAVEDADGEWFEIYATMDFDLNGLALGKDEDLGDAEVLALNDCMPISGDTRAVFAHSDDESVNGGLPQVDALFDFSLNQDNNQVVVSYQGTLLDMLPYGSTDSGTAVNVDPDFRTPELNDWTGFSCDALDSYGDGDLGTPGAPNINCEDIIPPEGQCFDGTTIRQIVPPTGVGDLVITEILMNPEASEEESDGEWFEIRANAAFDLHGLVVGRTDSDDEDAVATLAGDCAALAAGDYAVIGKERDPVLNGGLPRVDGIFDFSLANSSERGLWVGGTIDAPFDEIRWETSTAGAATSLDPGAIDPVANDDPANFCDAVDVYGDGDFGTPGAENPSCGGTPSGTCMDGAAERDVVVPQPGDLVITELMPNPDAVTDANGEWIEILAINAVDLNGLNIGDDPMDGSPARLAGGGECLAVPAGGRAVIAKSADMSMNGGLVDAWIPESGAISLGNNGDHTLSIWIGEDELDAVAWSGSTAGAAWTVDADAEDPVLNDDPANWCLASGPYGDGDLGSPGAQGPACGGGMVGDGMCLDGGMPRAIVPPLPGELVINEWMPNPDVVSDTDGEWFEVYVGADVDLNGVELSRITGGMFVLETTLSSPDCMSVSAGSHVVFARDLDVMNNGGLPVADIAFGFSLNNTNSGLAVGIEGVHLDEVTWASSSGGAATKVDPGSQTTAGNDVPGNLCDATTPYGPGDNAGTPGAMNPPC